MRWMLAVVALSMVGCSSEEGWAVAPGSKPVPNPLAPVAVAATCPCPAPVEVAAAAHATGPGATLFQTRTCVACHGKDGKTPILPNYPRISGQQAAYIEQQMKDIKSGARANGQTAAMRGIMGLVNDEEIHTLALYVSSMPR